MGQFEDLTGKRFGKLTVQERGPNYQRMTRWFCSCDCGQLRLVRASELRLGGSISCGCLRTKRAKSGAPIRARRAKVPREYKISAVEAAVRNALANTKRSAFRREYQWSLTDEQGRKLLQQPCFYCGGFDVKKSVRLTRPSLCNGIDRVDNTIGYLPDNCVPCCSICNRMKLTLPLETFLTHVRTIAYRHPATTILQWA